MSKPNIIFIQADQLAARQLHCYGGKVQSSPTLDKLATEGMRFDRCYTTYPVCLPNRASMLTGRSPVINGQIGGSTVLNADAPSYAHLLSSVGYRAGGFGKFHREPLKSPHPRVLDDMGFDEFNIVEDDKRGPYLEWVQKNHPDYYEMALGRAGKGWEQDFTQEQKDARARAREKYFWPAFKETGSSHMYSSPFPAEVLDATWITNNGIDFMDRHLKNHPDQPFFCQISYVDPHDPYDPPKPYDTMFSAKDMPDPLPMEWKTQGPKCLDEEEYNQLDCKKWRNESPELFKKALAYYHGSVRFIDDQIKRVIQFLEKNNLTKNTIVVFTTDHGDLMGDHGILTKFVHYDGSIRCPLIVWGAGIKKGTANDLACALDFFPTFCEFAGVDPETLPPLEGKSFAKTCTGKGEPEKWEEVAVQTAGIQSVVTQDGWRLTRHMDYNEGQMFNLAKDPDEQKNLYNLPEHAAKRQELLERLIKIGIRPNSIPRYSNVYKLSPKQYRLKSPQPDAETIA